MDGIIVQTFPGQLPAGRSVRWTDERVRDLRDAWAEAGGSVASAGRALACAFTGAGRGADVPCGEGTGAFRAGGRRQRRRDGDA